MSESSLISLWMSASNDANYIKSEDYYMLDNNMYSIKNTYVTFDPMRMFKSEKAKLESIVEECDIFISHIPPAWPDNMPTKYALDKRTSFYFFNGDPYLWSEKTPKLWICGHIHNSNFWKVNKTWLACNPIGYMSERNKMRNQIRIIDFGDLD